MHYKPFKSEYLNPPYDAIVIGSGIGGLCSAALLSKLGKKVLVLERHYVAGGFTHTYYRKGYEWDVGVHYIGEVHRKNSLLRKVFDCITDQKLQWAEMPSVYDKIFFPDASYELVAGVQNFKNKLYEYFPSEQTAIDQYLELVFALASSAKNYFSAKALPPLVSTLASPFLTSKFLKLANRTTLEVISSLTQNQKLIRLQVFGVAGPFEKLQIEDYRRQFETNIFGVLNTVKVFLPEILKQKGRIGIVGSVNSYIALPEGSPYAMSKFTIRAFAESLYYEMKPQGVSVSLIAPGFVQSEIRLVNNKGEFREKARDPIPDWIQIPADKAARDIFRAIQKRKPQAIITFHGKMLVWIRQHFPRFFRGIISTLGVKGRAEAKFKE